MNTETRHTPTLTGEYRQSIAICASPGQAGNILLVDNASGEHVAEVLESDPYDCAATWANLLITRYNNHAALVAVCKSLTVQDPLEYDDDADLPTKQVYSLFNSIRESARAILSQLEGK